jgi:hypothetical protein
MTGNGKLEELFAELLREASAPVVGDVTVMMDTVTLTIGGQAVTLSAGQAHHLGNRLHAAADTAAETAAYLTTC